MRITLGLFSALLMIIPRFSRMGLCKSFFFDYCVAIFGIDVFLILYHKIENLSIIKWKKGAAEATPQTLLDRYSYVESITGDEYTHDF